MRKNRYFKGLQLLARAPGGRAKTRSRPGLFVATFSTVLALIASGLNPLIPAEPAAASVNVTATGTNANPLCNQQISNNADVTAQRIGSDCVVTFRQSTTWTRPANVSAVRLLVIAGGGAGGGGIGGGGGAGEFVQVPNFTISSLPSINVVIGGGGVGQSWNTGGNGGDSVFGDVFAFGGAGGGAGDAPGTGPANSNGPGFGSGGGGSFWTLWRPHPIGVSYLDMIGSRFSDRPALPSGGEAFRGNGGQGTGSGSQYAAGGGGGGAGGNGNQATWFPAVFLQTSGGANGGTGGPGRDSDITGTSTFYAGGGGGGFNGAAFPAPGSSVGSGLNGGGQGGNLRSNNDAATSNGVSALNSTGSGGGGASNGVLGGNGGSGIVIVRYAIPNVTVTFNSNFGTPTTATQSIPYNSATNLAANSFTRPGYTFAGWHTTDSGTGGADYSNNDSVTLTNNLTLFAKWTEVGCVETQTSSGGYAIVKITQVGSCVWTTPSGVTAIEVAVIAGGGGGGFGSNGGGGGAGEVLVTGSSAEFESATTTITSTSKISTTAGSKTVVTIGAGGTSGAPEGNQDGAGPEASWRPGGNGGASSFGSVTANGGGGGGGGSYSNIRASGAQGGSGGGGANDDSGGGTGGLAGTNSTPAGWTSFKSAGGSGTIQAGVHPGYGGGGGAGGAGLPTDGIPGTRNGGLGVSLWGSEYAGGGGGWTKLGAKNNANDTVLGGNGRLDTSPYAFAGTAKDTSAGAANTGTGGGGGAPGGSGVVIIRFVETYTVTFNYDGATGGNSRADDSYTTEGVVITLPTPTKTGHLFEGWYEASDFSGSPLGDTYTTTQTRAIYAKWSPVSYTILFDYNGATSQNTTSSASFATGASGISLPAPLKSGHNFAGWFTSSSLVGSPVSDPFSPTANQTLYAKWNATNYSIFYSTEINVGGNTISATAGSAPLDSNNYNIGNAAVVLPNSGGLARAGYEFSGWVTSSDGTGSALNSGDSITFAAADVVLYPKWTPGSYSVSYNVNGATGTAERTSDSYTTLGSSITLPGVGSMVRNGYSFGGWSTTVNGSALSNANFTTTQNVTLYAVWTLTDFTVTFDLNGGAGAAAPTSLTANIEQTITIPGVGAATKTGHWFSGWNTEQDGSGDSYGASQALNMPLGGANLFAVWVPNQYLIAYNANGGSGGPVLASGFDTATDGQPYTIRDTGNLARAGYNFSHWSTDVGGAGLKYASDVNVISALQVFTPTANTTFYAQWIAIEYTFSFDSNGGSISPPNQTKTIGQLLTLPDPGFRTGYSFAGWSAGAASFQAQTNYPVGDSAVTFVATWTPNVYRVSFDWQGAIGTPSPMEAYTFGTGGVTLPTIGDRVRDGYSFSGWAVSANGTPVASFEPTSDSTLYAVWADGNFTLNFNTQGGTLSSAVVPVGRGTSISLPNPVRTGFVSLGWFTDPTTGVKVGDAGSAFTPLASQTLHARWIQRSLFGVDPASLENGIELTASTGASLDTTITHLASSSSARVEVPAGSLPDGTKINIRYFKDTLRQSELIPGDNNYLFSVLVSWLYGTGSTATVPDTDPGKPIMVTLTSSSIQVGANIFMLIGDQVTPMGTATQDGSVTVQLFEDPELVVARTRPDAPTSLVAVASDSAVSLSWSAPANNGGSQINSYTVTATPGGASCTTNALSCTISGLTNGTSYTFSVTALNSVGNSLPSTPTSGITPSPESFAVTFDSNGGSAVGNGNFIAGGAITQPANPNRSGFDFVGWSTNRDSVSSKVTFPFTPSQNAPLTLYALWQVAAQVAPAEQPIFGQGVSNPGSPAGASVVGTRTVSTNDTVVLEGSNFNQVTLVRVGGVEASFFINSEGQITIRVPANAPEGLLDVELVGPFGSVTLEGAITVKRSGLAVDRRVTIGTFLGFAAVYTKNHEGKRLSMRIGSKWRVIDPLEANYTYNFTKVGEGKTVTVMVYLDRKLVKVQQIKIQ